MILICARCGATRGVTWVMGKVGETRATARLCEGCAKRLLEYMQRDAAAIVADKERRISELLKKHGTDA